MADDVSRIETALVESVRTPDPYLNEIAAHLIIAGGKRLRPLLTVVAAQVCGPSDPELRERSIQGGIACELVQTGSLYHDDVMDEASTRRGVETVNAKWGNLQAILAGDFLLSRASEIAASLGTEVAGLLARTIGRLCEGQIEELRHTYNSARPESSYMASISGKTASLYATAARIGAIVAGFDRTLTDALTDYGEAYGIVFQIVDDLLDITSTDDQLGKPAGHDMVEGVYTCRSCAPCRPAVFRQWNCWPSSARPSTRRNERRLSESFATTAAWPRRSRQHRTGPDAPSRPATCCPHRRRPTRCAPRPTP